MIEKRFFTKPTTAEVWNGLESQVFENVLGYGWKAGLRGYLSDVFGPSLEMIYLYTDAGRVEARGGAISFGDREQLYSMFLLAGGVRSGFSLEQYRATIERLSAENEMRKRAKGAGNF